MTFLLFPLGVFIEAFMGILYPAESARMRRRQRVALWSLAGCLGAFGLVLLLRAIAPDSPAMVPLMGVGVVLMFAFLIAGKLSADEGEGGKKRDGS